MSLTPETIKALNKIQEPVIANMERPQIGTEGKDHVPYAIIPEGMKVQDMKPLLDAWLPKPERRKGTAIVHDVDSFVRLSRRFKAETSAIFCKGTIEGHTISAQLLSVLNYNPEGVKNADADWGDHRVQYDFPVSKDLKKWLESDGETFNQKDFAEFLEDNCRDLVIGDEGQFEEGFFGSMGTPKFATPSDIFQLSRGIEVRVNEKVHAAFRHSDGTQNVQFTSEHEGADGQPLRIPDWFVIGIRVFEDGLIYQIPVRLRYRVTQGSIVWFFQIYRMQEIFDIAFDQACRTAARELEMPMFKGTPERA